MLMLGRAEIILIPNSSIGNGVGISKLIVAFEKGSLLRNFNWILLLSYLTSANSRIEGSGRVCLTSVVGP